MSLGSSTTPARITLPSSARALGALHALISIALAVLLALGVQRLARHAFVEGLAMLIGVVVGRWLSSFGVGAWGDRAAARVRDRWRSALPSHLSRPSAEHEGSRADLALAIEQASDGPSMELLATSAVTSMAGLVVLWWAGGWLCVAITLGLLLVAVPLYQRAGRRSEALTADYNQRRALLEARQLELLHHTPELRALGAVEYGADEIAAISDAEHAVAIRAIRTALESSLVTEFLSGVSIGLVAMVVGFALLHGRISLAHALIAVLVTNEVFANVRRYGSEFHRRENSARALGLLGAIATTVQQTSSEALVLDQLVTRASDQPLTLVVHHGERVLVTGASGVGKSTLLETMVDWRAPRAGVVARAPDATGFVSAQSQLLSGTLRENLNLDGRCDDDTVQATLTALGLGGARFASLDAVLLANGRGLSAGEKVRLVLARALLAGATMVLLDDIGGVLDEPTRDQVRGVLERAEALTIIEATVDTPVLRRFDHTIVVTK